MAGEAGPSTLAELPKKAEISIAFHGSTVVYVCPPRRPDDPGKGSNLAGTVVLRLPKPRRIKTLTVELVIEAAVSLHQTGYETGKITSESVLLLEDQTLVAGEHRFDFLIDVPSTAAPYDKSSYGRVNQKVVARAVGDGWLGSTLETDSIFGVVIAPWDGDASLFTAHDSVDSALGTYTLGFSSSSFCTGGLLSISFNLQGSAQAIVIDRIEVYLTQQFTVTSLSNRLPSADPTAPPVQEVHPAARHKVLRLDGNNFGRDLHSQSDEKKPESELESNGGAFVPRTLRTSKGGPPPSAKPPKTLARLEAAEPFNVFHTFRLPRCDVLRPSVGTWTESPISKAHRLEADVYYRADGQAEMQKLVVSRSVDLFSCTCLLSNMELPHYSEVEPESETTTSAYLICTDDVDTSTLLRWERDLGKSHFSNPSIMVRRPAQRTKWEEQAGPAYEASSSR